MSDDCIFCAIAAGEAPARVVHETEETVAFLDANPLARGHALVVPRDHHDRLASLDGDLAGAVFEAVHDLAPRVERAVDADGTTIGVHDGSAAGQEVPHLHVHVVPRFEGDGGGPIHAAMGPRPDLSESDLDGIAADVRSGA